jgi:hypothetical protein
LTSVGCRFDSNAAAGRAVKEGRLLKTKGKTQEGAENYLFSSFFLAFCPFMDFALGF